MNIVLIGPPGSGKSVQAEKLSRELGYLVVNVGDLLYFESTSEGEIGKTIKQTMSAGGLVDEDIVTNLVEKHIADIGLSVIIDGFPRSVKQAKEFSVKVDMAIYFKVSEETSLKRLLKRGRSDDSLQVARERLIVYHKAIEPILKFYKDKGKLTEIDGEDSVEEIFKKTLFAINNYG